MDLLYFIEYRPRNSRKVNIKENYFIFMRGKHDDVEIKHWSGEGVPSKSSFTLEVICTQIDLVMEIKASYSGVDYGNYLFRN